jgi:glycosyltransferase involved in cell wall biosynthesis
MSGARVRVLYVVNSFVAGGAERHLLELWSRIDRARFEVEIACFQRRGQFTAAVEALGWPIHELGIGERIYGWRGWRGWIRLARLVRRRRPHVIHGYLFGPNLFAALAGRLCGVTAVVVAKRNVDAFETPRQVAVQRLTHRLATHVIAVSEAVAHSAAGLGVRPERITVILNGVDSARFDGAARPAPAELGLRPGVPVVGSVGCLAARKDYATLLDALALLDRRGIAWQAILVGDGVERGALERRAAALGVAERVRFLGERADVERLLAAMDVFVLPSREEGVPNALLEAMAAARPSVATAVGGTPEVMDDGITGWLVPPASAAALAAALEQALEHPDEAARRGRAARRATQERLGIDRMVRRHEDFYRRALDPGAGPSAADQARGGARSVAYVTTAFPTMTYFVESEVHRLRERGVRVRVFALRSPRGRCWQPEHEALLPLTRWVGSPLHPAGWLALLSWLLRRPRVLIPELLRVLWASRGSAYALAGHVGYLPAMARVARAVEREEFELVHGAWAHFPGTIAYLTSRLTGRPFSLAAHAGSDLYRTQAFLAEKTRAAEFVAACVRGNATMLQQLAGGGAQVRCIHHGVDLARFDGAPAGRDAEPLLLAVGRLAPPKGFDLAVRSLAALRARGVPARLELVGKGPERERLAALARELGVADRVRFRGELEQRELPALYARAWLLLAPSRVLANGRRDGIPNVVVEAMAMGVPCVGTRAAGLEEVILPGETGALVAPEDVAAMTGAVETLLRDAAERERLGANARALVRRRFDAERNFEALLALLAGREPAAAAAPAREGAA